jgi:predicted ribosome quality control (RQC) complex YloA/Tae2 family protein
MINIDFLTLKAFFTENIDFLIGARLQKIQQPTRRDFIFSLRNNGESKKLYLNISPQIYHIAFMNSDTEQKRNLKIPSKPPMFCMLLRKYLEGCKISDSLVIENERILEFHFETCDEFSQKRSLCLCFELMGKHSNVILYDRESYIIIGCAHNVGSEKSRYRELQGGLKYIYPPSSNSLSNELKEQFKNLNQTEIQNYLNTECYRPAIREDKYTLFSELLPNSIPQESVNRMIDEYYSTIQADINLKNIKNQLISIVETKLKKVQSSINKISTLLKKRDNTDKYKLYGELLTANLYKKVEYSSQIEVFNYISGENILIELDPNKTLNENAQRYFKLYTKSKTTKEKSTQILNGLNIEKDYLENILYSISRASFNELDEIKSELGFQEEKVNKKEPLKIMKTEINGFEVYIGKNNKQNDYIVSKLSKEEDYWFHTRLCAGSHVLLKVREKEPDEETIFECCKLAREYSSATQPSKVGVIYTKRKFIKKPPAAPLGYVIYKNEKEILI